MFLNDVCGYKPQKDRENYRVENAHKQHKRSLCEAGGLLKLLLLTACGVIDAIIGTQH